MPCPECSSQVIIDELEAELAAERAKVAELEKEECYTCKATRWEHSQEQWIYCNSVERSKVAQECAEIAKNEADEHAKDGRPAFHSFSIVAQIIEERIRAKFVLPIAT